MSVKSLLRETVASYLESKEQWIGKRMMPSGVAITLTPNLEGEQWSYWTSPTDGWCVIRTSQSLINFVDLQNVTRRVHSCIMNYNASNWNKAYAVYVPVQTGDQISAYISVQSTDNNLICELVHCLSTD